MMVISGSSGPALADLKVLLDLISNPEALEKEVDGLLKHISDLKEICARNEDVVLKLEKLKAENEAQGFKNSSDRADFEAIKKDLNEREISLSQRATEVYQAEKKLISAEEIFSAEHLIKMCEAEYKLSLIEKKQREADELMSAAVTIKKEYEEKSLRLKALVG